MDGARGKEYYISKPRWSSGKYGPWRPEFGPEGRHFVSGKSLFLYFWGSSEAARGAQRPVWHGNKTNKTVRARAAKTH